MILVILAIVDIIGYTIYHYVDKPNPELHSWKRYIPFYWLFCKRKN